ncbi:MAG: MFS transporter [Proteiniphilum sp.]|nr:MFS transporter [Proteiniphilum sp.]
MDLKRTAYPILIAVSFAHALNDLIQGIIPALYPQLEQKFSLSMAQIGFITLCFQLSASIFQPLVGFYTDKHPKPFSQVVGMFFSSLGIVTLAYAPTYMWVLVGATLVGVGSSVFHPESARIAFLASGGKRSFAQSIFQIGGNTGVALSPLLVALIVIPNGQQHVVWFLAFALLAMLIMTYIGVWRKKVIQVFQSAKQTKVVLPNLTNRQVNLSVAILLMLIFSKYFYVASITSFFQFYTLDKFNFTEVQAQVYLFYFLIAAAFGTLLGGYFGDKFGRKPIIWFSILGAAPFTLAMPYLNATFTAIFIVIIGLIVSSAFPAIIVYAQELLPKKLGMVSGLFYGFAFGMGGLGSAVLGFVADKTSIEFVYHICAYLPLIGLIAYFLPNLKKVGTKEE